MAREFDAGGKCAFFRIYFLAMLLNFGKDLVHCVVVVLQGICPDDVITDVSSVFAIGQNLFLKLLEGTVDTIHYTHILYWNNPL